MIDSLRVQVDAARARATRRRLIYTLPTEDDLDNAIARLTVDR